MIMLDRPAIGVLDTDTKRAIRRSLGGQKKLKLKQKERFIDGGDAALALWRLMPSFETLESQRIRLRNFAAAAERSAKTLHALKHDDLSLLLCEHPRFRGADRDLAVVEQFSDWLDMTVRNVPTLASCARDAARAPTAEMHSRRGRKALLIRQIRRTWDFVLCPLPGRSKTSKFPQVLAMLLDAVGERPASEETLAVEPENMFRVDDLVIWTYLAKVASRSRSTAWAAKCLVLEPDWLANSIELAPRETPVAFHVK